MYDVLVIGGGPAGLMAAGIAAKQNKHIALLEKNDRFGKKLLITGKGRCNIAHNSIELKDFIKFTQKIGYRKIYSLELLKDECLDNLYKKFYRKYIID